MNSCSSQRLHFQDAPLQAMLEHPANAFGFFHRRRPDQHWPVLASGHVQQVTQHDVQAHRVEQQRRCVVHANRRLVRRYSAHAQIVHLVELGRLRGRRSLHNSPETQISKISPESHCVRRPNCRDESQKNTPSTHEASPKIWTVKRGLLRWVRVPR